MNRSVVMIFAAALAGGCALQAQTNPLIAEIQAGLHRHQDQPHQGRRQDVGWELQFQSVGRHSHVRRAHRSHRRFSDAHMLRPGQGRAKDRPTPRPRRPRPIWWPPSRRPSMNATPPGTASPTPMPGRRSPAAASVPSWARSSATPSTAMRSTATWPSTCASRVWCRPRAKPVRPCNSRAPPYFAYQSRSRTSMPVPARASGVMVYGSFHRSDCTLRYNDPNQRTGYRAASAFASRSSAVTSGALDTIASATYIAS
jgi:hypothetical protein